MKIQVGQWYQCRNKSLIAQVVGTVLQGEYAFAIVMYQGGEYYDVSVCTPNGRYLPDDETHGFNLIEHIPGCDGPNWRQKRWRQATFLDAANGAQCRALKEEGELVGFQRCFSATWMYVKVGLGTRAYKPEDVEVLDEQA